MAHSQARQETPSRIVTLNVRHGGGRRVRPLAGYLSGTNADVLVITEFRTGTSGSELTAAMREAGYSHQHWTVEENGKNAVMIACRMPFEPVAFSLPQGHSHRLVGARFGSLELWAAYMALGKEKLPLYALLGSTTPHSTILIGDFNTGLHRLDEQGATFTAAKEFANLQENGWIDVWRRQHGPDAREYSWFSPAGNGFRLDHAFVSDDLIDRVSECRYDHVTRSKLTDHSALTLELTD